MIAQLIDPYTQAVRPIDLSNKTSEAVAQMQDAIQCDCFTTAGYLPNGDCIYVDDEGRINGTTHGFRIPSFNHGDYLMGRGLVVGSGPAGKSATAKTTAEQLYELLWWRICLGGDQKTVIEVKARDEWEETSEEVDV